MGHAHRSILLFASTRSSYILKSRIVSRKFSASTASAFHITNSVSAQSDVDTDSLTLSSLDLKNQVKFGKKGEILGSENTKLPKQITASKPKTNRNITKTPVRKNVLEIEGAPFAAKSFSELDLSPLLVDRLEKIDLTVPTDVQSAAIPAISKKHDVVIQSYTGSGKTFAYILPILSEVGPLRKAAEEKESQQKPGVEAVIVAPSRELAMQIVREVEKILGPEDKKIVQQLVGGANRSRQEEALKKNKPLVVVGTPGRIAEISAAGKLQTHGCRFLILDEVDQLLSFNYREDMHRILEHVGKKSSSKQTDSGMLSPIARRTERQTILVSATVPFSVIRAARSWGSNPLLVRANNVTPLDSVSTSLRDNSDLNTNSSSVTQGAIDSLPPALKHYYSVTKGQHKVDSLRRCIHALNAKTVIAFMNNTKPLKDTVFKLEARGIKAAELHGDLSKLVRSTTLKKFKNGEIRVLLTNELSARGLDVPDCDLVVNLDLPTDSIHYAHRAGRTGRLGREGNVVSICEGSEAFVVKKLRRQLGVDIRLCEFKEGELAICTDDEMEH